MELEDQKDPIIIEYFNYAMSDYAKLIIPPGKLCIIKGENNNGKSCLFYGLEWLLFNEALAKTLINNKSLEKNPNAELKVRITQGDYFIEIKRSMSSISYNINGVLHNKKLNKQSIFDIEENVRVPGFVFVKDCMYPLFNMQGEDRGLFPISENNDQNIYTLFEKLLGLINSKKILKAAQAELDDSKAKYALLETQCAETEKKLEMLNDTTKDLDEQKIQNLISNIEMTEKSLNIFKQNYETVKSMASSKSVTIPPLLNVTGLSEAIINLTKYSNAKGSLESAISQIKTIQNMNLAPMSAPNVELCIKIMQTLTKAKDEYNALNNESWKLSLELQTLKEHAKSLQEKWDAIEVCPMCGALKGEHVHA